MRSGTLHKSSAILGILLGAAVIVTPVQVQAQPPPVQCVRPCGSGSLLDQILSLFRMSSDPMPVTTS